MIQEMYTTAYSKDEDNKAQIKELVQLVPPWAGIDLRFKTGHFLPVPELFRTPFPGGP